jgi:hypothetical protein
MDKYNMLAIASYFEVSIYGLSPLFKKMFVIEKPFDIPDNNYNPIICWDDKIEHE